MTKEATKRDYWITLDGFRAWICGQHIAETDITKEHFDQYLKLLMPEFTRVWIEEDKHSKFFCFEKE